MKACNVGDIHLSRNQIINIAGYRDLIDQELSEIEGLQRHLRERASGGMNC
jgi:hypothetical protein